MTTTTYMEVEGDLARARAEIAELRELYTTALEKLGTLSGLLGFEPDRSLPVIVDQVQIKLGEAEALTGASITAAAKWLEGYLLSSVGQNPHWMGLLDGKNDDSWQAFTHDAKGLIEALRRR